jgi:hypothetical protein
MCQTRLSSPVLVKTGSIGNLAESLTCVKICHRAGSQARIADVFIRKKFLVNRIHGSVIGEALENDRVERDILHGAASGLDDAFNGVPIVNPIRRRLIENRAMLPLDVRFVQTDL